MESKPARGGSPSVVTVLLTLILLANSDGLVRPYALSAGNKERWQLQWKELFDEVGRHLGPRDRRLLTTRS